MAKKQTEEEVEPLSAKEAAIRLGTDARTFRKFMRDITPRDEQPGQGNRYQIDPDDVEDYRKQFAAWSKPKPGAKKGRPPKPPEEVDDTIYELEEVDEAAIEEMMTDEDEDFLVLDDD